MRLNYFFVFYLVLCSKDNTIKMSKSFNTILVKSDHTIFFLKYRVLIKIEQLDKIRLLQFRIFSQNTITKCTITWHTWYTWSLCLNYSLFHYLNLFLNSLYELCFEIHYLNLLHLIHYLIFLKFTIWTCLYLAYYQTSKLPKSPKLLN